MFKFYRVSFFLLILGIDSFSKDYSPLGFNFLLTRINSEKSFDLEFIEFSGYHGRVLFHGQNMFRLNFDLSKKQIVSDESIFLIPISVLCFFYFDDKYENVIPYLLNGKTYFPLIENKRIGIIESHTIISRIFAEKEIGTRFDLGLRLVFSQNDQHSSIYGDIGGSIFLSNKNVVYGFWVRCGFSGTRK